MEGRDGRVACWLSTEIGVGERGGQCYDVPFIFNSFKGFVYLSGSMNGSKSICKIICFHQQVTKMLPLLISMSSVKCVR